MNLLLYPDFNIFVCTLLWAITTLIARVDYPFDKLLTLCIVRTSLTSLSTFTLTYDTNLLLLYQLKAENKLKKYETNRTKSSIYHLSMKNRESHYPLNE